MKNLKMPKRNAKQREPNLNLLKRKLSQKKDCKELNVKAAQTPRKAHRIVKAFNATVLKAANETIHGRARRNYRPYWTEKLQHLEDQVSSAKEKVKQDRSTVNNIALNQTIAEYRRSFTQTACSNWIKKTEYVNLDNDGQIMEKSLRNEW